MDYYTSSMPENLPADQKRAIQELIEGRELANQLRILLTKPLKDDDDAPLSGAGDLVTKILGSFKNSLFILNSSGSDEASQVPANTGGSCDGGQKTEEADSGESSKTSTAFKDRRGCYKRRRTAEAVTKFSPAFIEDGHAWRKYGQKVILNAKYPRNYFRCTHKFDQGCHATKQVQRTGEDPPMYRTTYHGHHTCRNDHDLLLKPPQFILDSTAPRDSSILLSFEPNNNNPNPNPNLNTTLFFPFIKQETYKKEDLTSINHHHQSSSASTDYFLSPNNHVTTFGSSELLSPTGSDHGDVISSSGVYSSTTSTHSFEMDHMMVGVGGVHFDDDMVMDSFLL
nr:WRKY transcription factor [Panax notoginseng]